MAAKTPTLEWSDGSDDVRERLSYLESKVSARARNKKAIEQAAKKVEENIPKITDALKKAARDSSEENILAVAKLSDGRDYGLSGEAQKLYRTEMVVRMQRIMQSDIEIDRNLASKILERSFAEMITDSAKSAKDSLFEAMRAVEHDDMLKDDYAKIFGHKYKREAIAKKMEKDGQDDVRISNQLFTIGDKTYNIDEIQVLNGAAMTNIDPRMTDGFILKNVIIMEDGLIFAQMQNGCKGNFVGIKPGEREKYRELENEEVYDDLEPPQEVGAEIPQDNENRGGDNPIVLDTPSQPVVPAPRSFPQGQEKKPDPPQTQPQQSLPPQPASATLPASPTLQPAPQDSGGDTPTKTTSEGANPPQQIVDIIKDDILSNPNTINIQKLNYQKDKLRNSDNTVLQLLLLALAEALKDNYKGEGTLGEDAFTYPYIKTYDYGALKWSDEIASVTYATATKIKLPSDPERNLLSLRTKLLKTPPREGVLRVTLKDGNKIDILPADVKGGIVYEIDSNGNATESQRFSLEGRTIEYSENAGNPKPERTETEEEIAEKVNDHLLSEIQELLTSSPSTTDVYHFFANNEDITPDKLKMCIEAFPSDVQAAAAKGYMNEGAGETMPFEDAVRLVASLSGKDVISAAREGYLRNKDLTDRTSFKPSLDSVRRGGPIVRVEAPKASGTTIAKHFEKRREALSGAKEKYTKAIENLQNTLKSKLPDGMEPAPLQEWQALGRRMLEKWKNNTATAHDLVLEDVPNDATAEDLKKFAQAVIEYTEWIDGEVKPPENIQLTPTEEGMEITWEEGENFGGGEIFFVNEIAESLPRENVSKSPAEIDIETIVNFFNDNGIAPKESFTLRIVTATYGVTRLSATEVKVVLPTAVQERIIINQTFPDEWLDGRPIKKMDDGNYGFYENENPREPPVIFTISDGRIQLLETLQVSDTNIIHGGFNATMNDFRKRFGPDAEPPSYKAKGLHEKEKTVSNNELEAHFDHLANRMNAYMNRRLMAILVFNRLWKGPEDFLSEDMETLWKDQINPTILEFYNTPEAKMKLRQGIEYYLAETEEGQIDYDAQLNGTGLLSAFNDNLTFKDKEYEGWVEANGTVHKGWSGVKRWAFRQERRVPGFNAWFKKKLEAFKNELQKTMPSEEVAQGTEWNKSIQIALSDPDTFLEGAIKNQTIKRTFKSLILDSNDNLIRGNITLAKLNKPANDRKIKQKIKSELNTLTDAEKKKVVLTVLAILKKSDDKSNFSRTGQGYVLQKVLNEIELDKSERLTAMRLLVEDTNAPLRARRKVISDLKRKTDQDEFQSWLERVEPTPSIVESTLQMIPPKIIWATDKTNNNGIHNIPTLIERRIEGVELQGWRIYGGTFYNDHSTMEISIEGPLGIIHRREERSLEKIEPPTILVQDQEKTIEEVMSTKLSGSFDVQEIPSKLANKIVEALGDKGPFMILDFSANTPIELAVVNGHTELTRILLSDENYKNQARIPRGKDTLLTRAIKKIKLLSEDGKERMLGVIQLLVDMGDIDVNFKDANGKTAIDIAKEKGYSKVVALLNGENQGNTPNAKAELIDNPQATRAKPVHNEKIKKALKNLPLDEMYNELLKSNVDTNTGVSPVIDAYGYLKEGDIEGAKTIMNGAEGYDFDGSNELDLFYASVHYALFGDDKYLKQISSATNEDKERAKKTHRSIIKAGLNLGPSL
jgi:hypothetical protein